METDKRDERGCYFSVGDRVHYESLHAGEDNMWENGIIKKVREDGAVWVVYKCDEKWDKYMNYTGERTYVEDLKIGWRED